MEISDDSFENIKHRIIGMMRHKRENMIHSARDKKTAANTFELVFQFVNKVNLDEFSKEVVEEFDFHYEMGQKIEEIIDSLILVQRSAYLDRIAHREPIKTIIVKRKIWKLKLPIVKYFETYDHNGELQSRYKNTFDFSQRNVNAYKFAQTKQEKGKIIETQFVKKQYLYQKPLEPTDQIISPEVDDKEAWFKALVKYRANKEYLPELYASQFQEKQKQEVTQVQEKRKKETSKLVKWTDGKTKNNFTKLVYALHRAEFLENGNGEVTKMVDKLAPVFGIEMGDWESNFSKGITEQGYAYDHGAFFDDLKNSYLEIVKSRIETKELKKKIKKELDKKQGSKED
ncbi:MAG: RteC domain-containing protein [Bacteroidetes bacterium]|nr:RteC domain-containing protein [Bacteroidota bacterium]